MISRSDTVRALLEYIERVEGLLVVGNGFLSREAMRLGQMGSILPLQGVWDWLAVLGQVLLQVAKRM